MRGNPQQVAAEIRIRAAALGPALRRAETESVKEAQKIAISLSKGAYSSLELARMGHPYAKRRPRPPADPGIINKQTGQFLGGWRRKTGNWSGGTLFSSAFNISLHAKLLEAAPKRSSQIARPLPSLVLPRIRRTRMARLQAAIGKVL